MQYLSGSDSCADVIDFYKKSIKVFDFIATNLPEERLSDREVDFIACCLVCIDKGDRYIFSDNAFNVFSEIGNFSSIQEVRLYSNKPRVKKWIRKDRKEYKLPIFCENLLGSSRVEMGIVITLKYEQQSY